MRRFKWIPEKGSQRVLFAIIAVTAVVFAAYYLIGFNHPFPDDPDFNEPRLTDVLLWLMAAVVLFAIATAVWAIAVAVKRQKNQARMVNRVPVAVISSVVVAITVGILVVAFLMGSSDGVVVNGKQYADSMWLKAADMFVIASVAMIVLSVGLVAFSSIRSYLNKRSR
ncbi:MAG: hypothetical protein J5637_02575 [Prevotella sp.]|nr:hypothetical protein [Prevotella sp.]